MPAHDPSVGQALCSIRESSSSVRASTAWAPTASKTLTMSRARSRSRPGRIEPAVEEDRRQVEPGGGHEHAGQRLVAAGEGHQGVEPLGVHDRLDRVGDHLAADQRGPHPLVAHGDAVGDGDGDELEGEAAGVAHALLGPLGQPVERQVAGGDLVPARGHRRPAACPSRRRSSRRPGAWPGPAPGPAPRSPRSCGASCPDALPPRWATARPRRLLFGRSWAQRRRRGRRSPEGHRRRGLRRDHGDLVVGPAARSRTMRSLRRAVHRPAAGGLAGHRPAASGPERPAVGRGDPLRGKYPSPIIASVGRGSASRGRPL